VRQLVPGIVGLSHTLPGVPIARAVNRDMPQVVTIISTLTIAGITTLLARA